MDNTKTTPRDFFLWAGAMVSLYASMVAFILLIFNYIDYTFPLTTDYLPNNPYNSGIPYEMAILIVFGLLCIVLMRVIHSTIARDPSRGDIWIRRWALYLTLFVAGVALACDLVTLLYTFLAGNDITGRFILKVAVVLLVAGAGFLHFLADLRGYWAIERQKSMMVSIGVGALGIITVVAGFFLFGTPQTARLYRFDDAKITALSNLQSQIVSYWQYKRALPTTLNVLDDPTSPIASSFGNTSLKDPQTGESYEYHVTGDKSFSLCATFNKQSLGTSNITYPEPPGLRGAGGSENWQHTTGHVCFDRTIDPQLYPPVPPSTVPAKTLK